jgi:hypothetical protein
VKAWRVTLNDCDTVVVLAETRGKATWAAIREAEGWGADFDRDHWKHVRTRRVPALDGDTITERQMIEVEHMVTECAGCGHMTYPDDAQFNVNGAMFCTGCEPSERATPHGPHRAWFMSTEY